MNFDLDNTGIVISYARIYLRRLLASFLHCFVHKMLGRERKGYKLLQHMYIAITKLCKQMHT